MGNCRKTGLLNDAEFHVYNHYHQWLLEQFPQLRPQGILYLRTQPSTCYTRLHRRARAEEADVSKEYLQQLHECHEEWLAPSGSSSSDLSSSDTITSTDGLPVLVVDGNPEFKNDAEREQKVWMQIKEFAASLGAVLPM